VLDLIAISAAGPPTPPVSFEKKDMLTALLTTEGLLFTALSFAMALAGSSQFGPKTIVKPWKFAMGSTALLTVVAVTAVLAWADLFGGHSWPGSLSGKLEALGLLSAIVAQPVISLIVSLGIWRG
jgi:hypothetical protein